MLALARYCFANNLSNVASLESHHHGESAISAVSSEKEQVDHGKIVSHAPVVQMVHVFR